MLLSHAKPNDGWRIVYADKPQALEALYLKGLVQRLRQEVLATDASKCKADLLQQHLDTSLQMLYA